MSILTEKGVPALQVPIDQVYVIYGPAGSGKTVLASTFPKTPAKKQLYIDMLEGCVGSVSTKDKEDIIVVPIVELEELDEVLTDVVNGCTLDSTGSKIPVAYSSIVFDSLTQLEYIIKKGLKDASNKSSMTLQLWGQAKDSQEDIYNLLKYIHVKTGSIIVAIAHEKEIKDDENPGFNKIIPSVMATASTSLCAKASYVWYTKVEKTEVIDPATQEVKTLAKFVTYINVHPYLLTKSRKPKELKIPDKVVDLTYDMFKAKVIDRI